MRRPLIVLTAALAVACNHGIQPKDFTPANTPQGAIVAVRVQGETADRLGELLAVDSLGVTIGTGSVVAGPKTNTLAKPTIASDAPPTHIIRIAWARLNAMDLYRLGGGYDVLHGEQVRADKRARLALVSRFPQGLSGDLLAAALKAIKQDALEELK